ncbi:MAG: CHASE domain-containing protein, partial [Candidatus Omnitrophica bacterium]|nr:CHASE domain-containing protein [Candidatus Omnitrophota bacterium]
MPTTREPLFGDASRSAFRAYLPFYITVFVGITLSILVFIWKRNAEWHEIQNRFVSDSRERVIYLQRDIKEKLLELQSIEAFFAGSREVERKEFQSFVKPSLLEYESIRFMAWVPRVTDNERKKFESAGRDSGITDFEIRVPDLQGKLASEGWRKEYFPVCYAEPYYGNENLLGVDLAADVATLDAIKRARDTGQMISITKYRSDAQNQQIFSQGQNGKAQASPKAKIQNVPQEDQDLELWVFLPIYQNNAPRDSVEERRENLQGFALGVFRVFDFFEYSLSHLKMMGIDMFLFDESYSDSDKKFLYYFPSRTRKADYQPEIDKEKEMREKLHWAALFDVAGRKWSVLCVPAPSFFEAEGSRQSWFILIIGFLITGMASSYLLSDIGRTAQVERLVEKRTLELSRVNRDLEREIHEHEQT